MDGLQDLDFVSVFEGSQLFQLFQGFEVSFRQGGEFRQEIHPETVKAKMLIMNPIGFAITAKGYGISGKIDGKTLSVCHHFYVVRVLNVALVRILYLRVLIGMALSSARGLTMSRTTDG